MRACLRVTIFLVNPINHHIRHGPHAFTSEPCQKTHKPDLHHIQAASANPGGGDHIPLRIIVPTL